MTRQGTRRASRYGWLALASAWLLLTPALLAADDHGPAHAGDEAAAAHASEHGDDHHGEHEELSELAVEHGSWLRAISEPINRAVGFPIVSGPVLIAFLIALFISGVAFVGTAGIRAGDVAAEQPSGLQNFLEMVVEGFEAFALGIIGPHGKKYVPLVASFFLFIILNNYSGVIPGFVAPTSTLNMTLALGLTAFLSVQYFAIQANGLGGYLLHFAGSPKDVIGWALAPLMFVLELVGEMVKPLSLAMRLFGNIFGEDTVFIQLGLFALGLGGWQFYHGHVVQEGGWWSTLLFFIPLPMQAFMLFGGLIQALVFTMLVCIYISLLTSHEHDEGHAEHGEDSHH